MKERVYPQILRLVFEDKPLLRYGFGGHTAVELELTWEQLRGIVLDAMPELLKR